MKSVFLGEWFFYGCWILVGVFALSYSVPVLYNLGLILLVIFIILVIYGLFQCRHWASKLKVTRNIAPQLSMSDEQYIKYTVTNENSKKIYVTLFDEYPEQLQLRDDAIQLLIEGKEEEELKIGIRPNTRGQYNFGNINAMIRSTLKLIEWRKIFPAETVCEVYPSFIQMKNYELQLNMLTASLTGIRKIRQIGENDEFEHIMNYKQGDNIKSINWKATSRKGELMVNHFENTKSQMVYCIIDKGRSMEMPFFGLSLLDYAINTCLTISNIVLKKYDKIGMLSFDKNVDTRISASDIQNQINRISRALYNQQTAFSEPNYEKLYFYIRNFIKRRSILFLFTNFEQTADFERNLPYLKALNKMHLLIVIFFKNTEIEKNLIPIPTKMNNIYYNVISREAIIEKEKLVDVLKLHGIQAILTDPKSLSINTINMYLEIKAKRMM